MASANGSTTPKKRQKDKQLPNITPASKSAPPALHAVAPGEFRITAEEMELVQLYRKVPLNDRVLAKGYLELSLRDMLIEAKSKQPTLSLVRGGA